MVLYCSAIAGKYLYLNNIIASGLFTSFSFDYFIPLKKSNIFID